MTEERRHKPTQAGDSAHSKRARLHFSSSAQRCRFYEAFYVSGTGSQFFIPLIAGGLGRILVARLCLRGTRGAFVAAAVFAFATSAIDIVSSNGDYLDSALYVGPQILVIIFSFLSLSQLRARRSAARLGQN